MANPRLTKSVRREIKNHLLSDRFDAEQERIDKLVAKIGPLAYEVAIPKKLRDAIKLFPKGWLKVSECISVGINGEVGSYQFGFIGDDSTGSKIKMCVPENNRKFSTLEPLSFNRRETYTGKAGRVFHLVSETRKSQDELDKAKRSAEVKINAVLDAAGTRKKLLEIWPEIEVTLGRIWPNNEAVKVTTQLAVKMDELNENLGLPEVVKKP